MVLLCTLYWVRMASKVTHISMSQLEVMGESDCRELSSTTWYSSRRSLHGVSYRDAYCAVSLCRRQLAFLIYGDDCYIMPRV